MAKRVEIEKEEFFPILGGDEKKVPVAPPEAVVRYVGWREGWMRECEVEKECYPAVSLGYGKNKERGGFWVRKEVWRF